jgi:hypothetical protein
MRTKHLLAILGCTVGLNVTPTSRAEDDKKPPKSDKLDAKALAAITPEELYPLQVKEKRVYEIKNGTDPIIMEVTKKEKVGKYDTFLVEASVKGEVKATENMMLTKDGIFRVKMGENLVDPPFQVVKFPLKDGDTWKGEFKTNGVTVKTSSEVSIKDVKVPAGEYKNAIVVHSEAIEGESIILSKIYLVPKIGMVKQQIELPKQDITLMLDKYTKGDH